MKFTEPCPICGAVESSLWMYKDNFPLIKCGDCSLVFIPKSLYKGSSSAQYRNDETSPVAYYLLTTEADKKNFRSSLQRVEKFLQPGNVLDVGANVGTFLDVARERGWWGVGIEPNPAAIREGEAKGLTEYQGYFDENFLRRIREIYPDKVLDVIYMGDVIEHVFDPLVMLERARTLLRSGGLLVIVTPDIDTFFAKKFQIKPKEHLVYFNKKSMLRALMIAKFEPLIVERQSRKRYIARISEGTTKLGFLASFVSSLARFYPLGSLINYFAGLVIRDELFIIAKKA